MPVMGCGGTWPWAVVMRSVDEHVAAVLGAMRPLQPRRVALAQAAGAVTAEPIVAPGLIPPFDNSAMDGYAVRAVDCAHATAQAPVSLRVVGESAAGYPAAALGSAAAVRIMTGAPVPLGATAVIAQERVDRDGDLVIVREPAPEGQHIRRAGEDARPGDQLVASGVQLRSRQLAAAAAAGVDRIAVIPAPVVAVIVTGDELVPAGGTLGPGQIFESNGVTLTAALTAAGARVEAAELVGDVGEAVHRAVVAAIARGVDLVVTTGGASVGAHDPAKEGLAPAGIDFVSVAMQPGKPQGLGVLDGVPVVCLPGNPVAVAVCVELFLAPAIRHLRGVPEPDWLHLRAASGWGCPPGREQFMPVVIDGSEVRPATSGGSGSHLVARLAAADGLARVPARVEAVAAGDTLAVRRFTT